MSVQAVRWAFSAHVGNADAKSVLVALADCHSATTGNCYPSQESLAAKTERSIDTIQRHLKYLEERGLIKRKCRYKNGYRTSDQYELALTDDLTPQQSGVSSAKLKPQGNGVRSNDLTPQNSRLRQNSERKLTPQTEEAYTANDRRLDRTAAVYRDEREVVEREEVELRDVAESEGFVSLSNPSDHDQNPFDELPQAA
jgi:DNA-binding transcriptional MocR family regulator